ncbi:MAG: hypothetical protein ACKV2T_04890 [Kofleriaceae bacterium]
MIVTRKILVLSFLVGCGGDVPVEPTYFSDVQPILRANCARCHGAEPSDPKIAKFRLDRYVQADTATFDAWDYAQASGADAAPMIRVAVDHEAPAMPPDYSLTDRQREILARWVEQGAPKGMRTNRAPRVVLATDAPTVADQTLDVSVRAWDDDLDGLVVQLWAHDLATTADQDVPLGETGGAGIREVALDTGALASQHAFEIYAIADDGFSDNPEENRTHVTLIPALTVDHGARGTAPTVKLTAPNASETLIGDAMISWTATDPDPGGTLLIDLALVRADSPTVVAVPIATGIPNNGSFLWTIPGTVPVTDASGPINYLVRVTATDTLGIPPNTRSDVSDVPVTIARAVTTTLTWDDVKPIFLRVCVKCHGQPAKTMALESFRLDKYDSADPEPPVTTDQGVFEMKGTVYQRMVTARTMPPAAEPDPTAAELDMVANWILGGAPRGGGTGDARPTFTWVMPSMTQTGSTTVMLQWTAGDVEGLASGRIEYAKLNGIASTGCSNTTNATWMAINNSAATATLAGAMTWNTGFVWTVPSTPNGYYCVRGTVTDLANQTTTSVNTFGIR